MPKVLSLAWETILEIKLAFEDKHCQPKDILEASPPDYELVSLEVMEIVIPKVGGIDDDILLTIKDDILHEKLLNINLLIANIKALKDNPTPSSDLMTKSSSTSLNFLLEETNTFDNSLPESETFCFDLEEISSGSTTTHYDCSLYDSFIFDFRSIHFLMPIEIENLSLLFFKHNSKASIRFSIFRLVGTRPGERVTNQNFSVAAGEAEIRLSN
nr:hypothetical protein [Tanacetum cinerariifolium]